MVSSAAEDQQLTGGLANCSIGLRSRERRFESCRGRKPKIGRELGTYPGHRFGLIDHIVASVIEEFGASGRMVGIVTHIRELAERMPVRLGPWV